MNLAAAALAVGILCAPSPASSPAAHRRPPVFATGPYDAVAARAVTEKRFLVVDVASVTCPPCRQMEREAWVDPEVESWFREHGVAVHVLAEDDRQRAKMLKVDAYPTLIALRDGRELDRVVGFQSAADLIAWLEAVRAGKRKLDLLREKAGDRTAKKVDVSARHDYAQALIEAGALDEATDELAWLWENATLHDPSMHGVRGSFMASDIERLVDRHPPARAVFEKLRAAAEKLPDRDDWIVLNSALGQDAVTLAWFDKARNDPAQQKHLARSDFRLRELLLGAERWADVAVLYPRPLEELSEAIEMRRRLANEGPEFAEMEEQQFGAKIASLYAALLAAGREKEATELAAKAFAEKDSRRMREAFVRTALKAKQARTDHLAWDVDEDLKASVREKLGKRPAR